MASPFNIDGLSMQRDAFLLLSVVAGSETVVRYFLENRREFVEGDYFPQDFAEVIASDLVLSLAAKSRNALDGHGWGDALPVIGRLLKMATKAPPKTSELALLMEAHRDSGGWKDLDFREGCNKVLHAEVTKWTAETRISFSAVPLSGSLLMSGQLRNDWWLCELDVRKFAAYIISQF
jgi:hypothetical protein